MHYHPGKYGKECILFKVLQRQLRTLKNQLACPPHMLSSSAERGAFTFESSCSIPTYDFSIRDGADTQLMYVADEGIVLEL